MKKLAIISLSMLAALVINNRAFSQTPDSTKSSHVINFGIPKVALVDVEPSSNNTISITATAPTEAGLPIVFSGTDSTLWLNYSSIIKTTPNKVSVKASTTIPGIDLKVKAGNATQTGDGTYGTAASVITLSTSDQDIVTGIGSCYTGDGVNKGHNLLYTMAQNGNAGAYAAIQYQTATPITVTYTITAN